MLKNVFAITFFASTSIYAWNLSEEVIREKSQDEPPLWMIQRIEKDIQEFRLTGVTNDMIDHTLETIVVSRGGSVAELVRLSIEEGDVTWRTPFTLSTRAEKRLEILVKALETLHKIAPLPNVSLLVSLASKYERPFFLHFTDAPVFTVTKEEVFTRSVLFPDNLWDEEKETLFARVQEAAQNIPWEIREPKAFWRGSLSESYEEHYWDFNSRPRLVFFSRAHPDLVDAALIDNSYIDQMDFYWRKWIRSNGFLRPLVSPEAQLQYRYLVALDGEGAPSSLSWQLFSGSTLLKAESTRLEWFSEGFKPFIHYLPFNPNRTEIGEKIQWLQQHDQIASTIAENASAFAKERLTDNNAFLYTYYLLNIYAQLYRP